MRIVIAIAFLVAVAAAQDAEEWKKQLEAEKKAREADKKEFEQRLNAVEQQQNAQLHQEIEDYLSQRDLFEAELPNAKLSGGSLIDISVILDATVGGSTASDEALAVMNLGDHDPKVRGFNVRNEELVISADVDPYFYGLLDVVYKINEEGESEFELEEAYGLTTSLPANLQFKIGQFFTEFGRANPTHPHTWEFLNFPVILGRIFGGDGFRGQGARLSWLVPGLSFPVTLLVGAQNAKGETQASFLGVDGDMVGAYTLMNQPFHGLSDLTWNARAEASRDFAAWEGTLTALVGFSFAYGPNGTGSDANTTLYGTDIYLKWKPARTEAGWPFVAWQTEFLWRDYDAAAQATPTALASTLYNDWGFYTQVIWAFRRPWTAGIRYDYAYSNGANPEVAERISIAITYYTSEFARIRLEANWDFVDGLSVLVPGQDDRNFSLWINFDFSLGKHGAHKF